MPIGYGSPNMLAAIIHDWWWYAIFTKVTPQMFMTTAVPGGDNL
jgi:hypothetical protein